MRNPLGMFVLAGALSASFAGCGGGGSSSLPNQQPTPIATLAPSATPSATPTPAATATPQPTASPTTQPTAVPSASPSATPTSVVDLVAAAGGDYIVDGGLGIKTSKSSLKNQDVLGGGHVGSFANANGTITFQATAAANSAYAKIRVPAGKLRDLGIGHRAAAGIRIQGDGPLFASFEFTLPNGSFVTAIYPLSFANEVTIDATTPLVALNSQPFTLGSIANGDLKTPSGNVTADSPFAVYVYTVGTGNYNIVLRSLAFI